VLLQDLLSLDQGGEVYLNVAVEAARTEKGIVQDVLSGKGRSTQLSHMI
jgi:hypothetical protein